MVGGNHRTYDNKRQSRESRKGCILKLEQKTYKVLRKIFGAKREEIAGEHFTILVLNNLERSVM